MASMTSPAEFPTAFFTLSWSPESIASLIFLPALPSARPNERIGRSDTAVDETECLTCHRSQ